MNTYYDFRFQTNVSLDTYQKKTDATACLSQPGAKAIGKEKMAFKELTVNVTEFLGLATSGHAFCNLFDVDPDKKYWVKTSGNKSFQSYPVYRVGVNKGGLKVNFKKDEYFKGTQTFFVDIDLTKYTKIPEYIAALSLKPTCIYMSFSDNKDKGGKVSRRFRMVYVMDEIVGKDDFYCISRELQDRIIFDTCEPMDDDCGTRMSQYMNGVYGNSETYRSDTIYSITDFDTQGTDYIFSLIHQNNEEDCDDTPRPTFNESLVKDMGTMDYVPFMSKYSRRYKYIYRPEKSEWEHDLYQFTDDDYLQLWYYREAVKDGEHRRRKLFKNACLRRLMMPEIDADTLLFNLFIDTCRFFDNEDKAITIDTLKRKVLNAMEKTPEQLKAYCHFEIKYWKENRPQFIMKPHSGYTLAETHSLSKLIRWEELDKIYDTNISLKENLETNCIGVPERTLYRYCEERGIRTNPYKDILTEKEKRAAKKTEKEVKIEVFKKLYNPEKSIRENIKVLENEGLKLSTRTVSNWIEKYYNVEVPELSFNQIKEKFTTSASSNITFDTSWFEVKESPKNEKPHESIDKFMYKPWGNFNMADN